MMKFIVIALLACAGWFLYNNWDDITSSMLDKAKQDKTVQVVGNTRGELNSEAEEAMNK